MCIHIYIYIHILPAAGACRAGRRRASYASRRGSGRCCSRACSRSSRSAPGCAPSGPREGLNDDDNNNIRMVFSTIIILVS